MAERKVIQKYYPPDFDPSKLPKVEKPKNNEMKVRMMLPMSVRCTSCGEFLGRGKKYNARKETVAGEEYLGIKVFRFYMRCTRCSAEFTIKTDPKNSDYTAELGVTRNFEPWKGIEANEAAEAAAKAKAEAQDAMSVLEARTAESKRELELHDTLQELRALKAHQNLVQPEQLAAVLPPDPEALAAAQDEALAAQVVFQSGPGFVRRLRDDGDDDDEDSDTDETRQPAPSKRLKVTPETTLRAPTSTSAATAALLPSSAGASNSTAAPAASGPSAAPKPAPAAPAPAAPSIRVVAKPKKPAAAPAQQPVASSSTSATTTTLASSTAPSACEGLLGVEYDSE